MSNNIFFDNGYSTWLVDSGYATHSAQTVEFVELKLGLRRLNFQINTHLHSDHCGGNAALQRKLPLLITKTPAGQFGLLSNWDSVGLFYTPSGRASDRFKFNELLKVNSDIELGFQK